MEIENNVVNEEIKVESTETNQVEVKEEKTFTQEELDKILNKKFAQWQKKTEEAKAEAERKAKFSFLNFILCAIFIFLKSSLDNPVLALVATFGGLPFNLSLTIFSKEELKASLNSSILLLVTSSFSPTKKSENSIGKL